MDNGSRLVASSRIRSPRAVAVAKNSGPAKRTMRSRMPTCRRAAFDVGEVVAVEAAEFGDVGLGGSPEDVERGHQGGHADPDERAVQDDTRCGDDRHEAFARLDAPDAGDLAGLDEMQRAGQNDRPESRDRQQREGPVRKSRTSATVPAAMIPASWVATRRPPKPASARRSS